MNPQKDLLRGENVKCNSQYKEFSGTESKSFQKARNDHLVLDENGGRSKDRQFGQELIFYKMEQRQKDWFVSATDEDRNQYGFHSMKTCLDSDAGTHVGSHPRLKIKKAWSGQNDMKTCAGA
ncbi:hypothetical protein RB195_009711 [Necator americanus]|uniref:Uncharacterized protein n=1 Tax=Necator americanus TaxID=51031 RepID=A0ABR1CUJ0_NECAM